jgi:hypothetical protein
MHCSVRSIPYIRGIWGGASGVPVCSIIGTVQSNPDLDTDLAAKSRPGN